MYWAIASLALMWVYSIEPVRPGRFFCTVRLSVKPTWTVWLARGVAVPDVPGQIDRRPRALQFDHQTAGGGEHPRRAGHGQVDAGRVDVVAREQRIDAMGRHVIGTGLVELAAKGLGQAGPYAVDDHHFTHGIPHCCSRLRVDRA